MYVIIFLYIHRTLPVADVTLYFTVPPQVDVDNEER